MSTLAVHHQAMQKRARRGVVFGPPLVLAGLAAGWGAYVTGINLTGLLMWAAAGVLVAGGVALAGVGTVALFNLLWVKLRKPAGARTRRSDQPWEYASTITSGPAGREHLDALGRDGWELVSVLSHGGEQLLYVFKRPKRRA